VTARLSPEVRQLVIKLAAQGKSYREIVKGAGVSMGAVTIITKPLGGVIRPELWNPSSARLSLDDRVNILLWLEADVSFAEIGRRLGRVTSTVSREVGGQAGRKTYRPVAAHRCAGERALRPKTTLLVGNPVLCDRVIKDLKQLWSPEQISGRLLAEFPDDLEMRVSYETIYKSLYIQGRGELKRELTRCLRTGRTKRLAQGRTENLRKIPGMVPISERPPEAADRAVPGHWEGDLIIGTLSRSAVGTLVERTSRFTLLLHLPDDHGATAVREAATAAIQTVPAALMRSLTWDQGREMLQHLTLSIDTGVKVYFCDPRSPWQRPTNENTNGLLRQYMPKSTDLRIHSADDLAAIAHSLNTRPRKILGYMTPSEKFAELVASTD
jgi:transposase, IS30 family